MHWCCVVGCCHQSRREKCSFHRIPKIVTHQGQQQFTLSKERRKKFLIAIRRKDWAPNDLSRICSCHFVDGKPAKLLDNLNPNWIPNKNMGYNTKQRDHSRYKRSKNCVERKAGSFQSSRQNCSSNDFHEHQKESIETGVYCQTDLTMEDISMMDAKLRALQTEIAEQHDKLREKDEDFRQQLAKLDERAILAEAERSCALKLRIEALESELHTVEPNSTSRNDIDSLPIKNCLPLKHFSKDALKNDPEMLTFYTGINDWIIFEALFELVKPLIQAGRKMSKFMKFVTFFLKIRLNLLDQDIAYCFNVHNSSVSRSFHEVRMVLHKISSSGHNEKFFNQPCLLSLKPILNNVQ